MQKVGKYNENKNKKKEFNYKWDQTINEMNWKDNNNNNNNNNGNNNNNNK